MNKRLLTEVAESHDYDFSGPHDWDGLETGDIVIFCKNPEGIRHNALIIDIDEGGKAALVHIVKPFDRAMPQVELNVRITPDENGRYYVI